MAGIGVFDDTVDQIYGPSTGQINRYLQHTGQICISVAAPDGTPPKIVKLSASYGGRSVSWKATKQGNPPLVPAMQSTQTGDIFMSGSIDFAQPQINTNLNSADYAVQGLYFYIQPLGGRQACDGGDWFNLGQYPQNPIWMQYAAATYGMYLGALAQATPLYQPNPNGMSDSSDGTTFEYDDDGNLLDQGDMFFNPLPPMLNDAGNPAGNLGVDFNNPLYAIVDPTTFYPDFFSPNLIT